MALPTAEQVTNKYLYGTEIRPTDLLDQKIIDHRDNTVENEILVDVTEYMVQGPGRFVSSANFEFIEEFFDLDLAPKIYSKVEILTLLGYIDLKWSN